MTYVAEIVDDEAPEVAKLRSVAGYLFWVSAMWAVLMGLGVVGTVLLIVYIRPEGDDLAFRIQSGMYNLIFGAISLLICVGARQMSHTRSYGLSVIAALLSCVPCVSPWFIVGIPFGVWAFLLLRKPAVKAAFSSK